MSGSQTFQLISRRRLIGLTHGTMRSVRRGRGTEVAGSRAYRPGDDIRSIDWAASARMSSARGADEFVVRERYADEGPRVVIVADRSAELSFFSAPLPWLDKAEAMQRATDIVVASAAEAGGFVGYLDYAYGEPYWLPPRGERRLAYLREERAHEAGWGLPSTASSVRSSTSSSIAATSRPAASSSCSPTSSIRPRARRGSQPSSTSGTSYLL